MVEYDDTEETMNQGILFFPDGRPARSTEERVQASRLQEEAQERREAELNKKHMEASHPEGLAEIKLPDGSVARKGGSKPWLK